METRLLFFRELYSALNGIEKSRKELVMFELINKLKIEYMDFWYDHIGVTATNVTTAIIAVCGGCALILLIASIIDEKLTK